MDEFTHGGTPPTLWHHQGDIPLHLCHPGPCLLYDRRLRGLAKQIEKLSWMLELMDDQEDLSMEGAERQWPHAHVSLK